MQNNSTPESTSASTEITINCILWDNSAGMPVSCADVVLTSAKDGTQVYGTTSPSGKLCAFVEIGNTEWKPFTLPYGGEWLIDPNTGKFPTHYFFAPLTYEFPSDDSEFKIPVDGDNEKNIEQLELYVENVFTAGKDIFMAELKRRVPQGTPQAVDIQAATDISSRLVENGLAFVKKSLFADIIPADAELACQGLLAYKGETDTGLRDKILCSLCYTRYSTNQARLNTCLCCEPCIPG